MLLSQDFKDVEALFGQIDACFARHRDPREAHRAVAPILRAYAERKTALRDVFRHALAHQPDRVLNVGAYPQPGLELRATPAYALAVNCWLPHETGRSDLSTKTVHHHGQLLLTTACIEGPGYEHWVFSAPEPRAGSTEVFDMSVESVGLHPRGSTAFVEAHQPHCPFYPVDLSVTLALWSHSQPLDWKAKAKHWPLVRQNRKNLARLVQWAGLGSALGMNIIRYFDFYPSGDGYIGMRERQEFPRGSNADHVQNIFYVLQRSGNATLAPELRAARQRLGTRLESPEWVDTLLTDLEAGREIPIAYWEGHHQDHALFSSEAVQAASAGAFS